MDFVSYVNSLPNQRQEMTEQLQKLCRVSGITIYRWLRGDTRPDALKRKVIAEYLHMSEDELWPEVMQSKDV